jgi:hypothetical protein
MLDTPSLPVDEVARRLIDLRHEGTSWSRCAELLGYSVDALKTRARRLRDAEAWLLADGSPACGQPSLSRGRPKNRVPTVPVSPRFSPDTAEALRMVARCAGLRLGEVVAEAMQRAVDRSEGRRPSTLPCGLERGEIAELCDGQHTETISVNVPLPIFDACTALDPSRPAMTVIAEVVTRLLVDLNYRLVDCTEDEAVP